MDSVHFRMSQDVPNGCVKKTDLQALVLFVRRAASAGGRLSLGQGIVILDFGTVKTLVEDGLELIDFELGLKVMQMVRVATAVGTASGVGELELFIDDFLAWTTPGSRSVARIEADDGKGVFHSVAIRYHLE